jgi:UDP-GlcNAc:undecaprenyl-phosphate/decaprenyl-phosphate GlcNAc-1-phosphate transferase
MNNFQNNTSLFVIIAIGVTFLLSLLFNSILLKFSQNLGARQNQVNQNQVRWNQTVRPSVGGISFFVVFLITFIVINFIDHQLPLKYNSVKVIGVFIVCTIAFLMGLADDAYNTQPLLKFITQLLCGIILYYTDTKISIFSNEPLNFSFTIFWVIGLMNSINMLDNMDAITTIVSINVLFFTIALNLNLNSILSPIPILSLGILGSLLGFLVYNWHPAKMFMGDTGSQFLGAFLAVLGIDYCWNASYLNVMSNLNVNPILIGFISIALIFVLPLTDTITVSINRISRGQSPFVGGKDHTTHHLFFRGITEKRIAIIFFIIALTGVIFALNLALNFQPIWVIISIVFCAITFVSLYLNTIIKRR